MSKNTWLMYHLCLGIEGWMEGSITNSRTNEQTNKHVTVEQKESRCPRLYTTARFADPPDVPMDGNL
jgi:hypothetical protein